MIKQGSRVRCKDRPKLIGTVLEMWKENGTHPIKMCRLKWDNYRYPKWFTLLSLELYDNAEEMAIPNFKINR